MNYTNSNSNVVHAGTGHRMHQDTLPVTTVFSADDANMLIWSLMKLLEAASIAPANFDPATPATYSRVLLAIQALASGAHSLTTNGYQVLPSGLVMQWGTYTGSLTVGVGAAPSPTTVMFPMEFGAACLNVQMTTRNPGNDYVADCWPELVDMATDRFHMVPQNTGNAGTDFTLHGFTWFAIGY